MSSLPPNLASKIREGAWKLCWFLQTNVTRFLGTCHFQLHSCEQRVYLGGGQDNDVQCFRESTAPPGHENSSAGECMQEAMECKSEGRGRRAEATIVAVGSLERPLQPSSSRSPKQLLLHYRDVEARRFFDSRSHASTSS